eukprot:TRINITY_DN3279_c0_g1_i2.p2 TRINITY_DN3279_c0_g1~~TRINITY_DN3279_c0_g1_i2.p2  ORF type:complete len:269 (-),score=59.09 TRINITY_DN3279_c0_g1_i2:1926-2732(-)
MNVKWQRDKSETMNAPTPEEAWRQLPPVTKIILVSIVLTTALSGFGLVHPLYLVWNFTAVFKSFQLWRVVTCFLFFGSFSFGWLMNIMFIYQYASQLEKVWFNGQHGTSDFVFMLMFGGLVMLLSSAVFPFMIYGPAMMMMLVHITARKDPYKQVNFWGFGVLAWQFPFCLMLLHMLMGGGADAVLLDVIGVLVGHLYFFLTDIYPKVRGITLLVTPLIVISFVEKHIPAIVNSVVRGFGGHVVTVNSDPSQANRPQWARGQGRRLDS